MTTSKKSVHAAAVIGAGAIVLLLGGSLALRAADRPSDAATARRAVTAPKGPVAPATGRVPQPAAITLADIPQPTCWSCPGNHFKEASFQFDLDLLAPLGDGSSNAALWLRRFARNDGDRFQENYKADAIEVEIAGKRRKVMPPDSAFLAEAEPWLDQARCSFYPDVWELGGADTRIANMLLVLDLARSFIARGQSAEDPDEAMEDFRRVVRLGRLLRQDDATVIHDLIASECIRLGTWAMNQLAREQGDVLLLAATNSVLADHDSIRARTSMRVRIASRMYESVNRGLFGGLSLELVESDVDSLLRMVKSSPERRFRLEGLVALRAVYQLGDARQRAWVEDDLRELAGSDDAHLARLARMALEQPLSEQEEKMLEDMVHHE